MFRRFIVSPIYDPPTRQQGITRVRKQTDGQRRVPRDYYLIDRSAGSRKADTFTNRPVARNSGNTLFPILGRLSSISRHPRK